MRPQLPEIGSLQDQAKLRALSALFLKNKEFYGTHGLVVNDDMATSIAAQACLPLLDWGKPSDALRFYDDFVGIVLYPAEAIAHRKVGDVNGIQHQKTEILLGEAMQGGPLMLSWPAVEQAGRGQFANASVVIHEFIHKIDMCNGAADGYPPLPTGYLGYTNASEARAHWTQSWSQAFNAFKVIVLSAQQGHQAMPWLDAYAATAPAEFFAVACEAYFVNPDHFSSEFPSLFPLLQAYFKPSLDQYNRSPD
jgi:MtfA peptidase